MIAEALAGVSGRPGVTPTDVAAQIKAELAGLSDREKRRRGSEKGRIAELERQIAELVKSAGGEAGKPGSKTPETGPATTVRGITRRLWGGNDAT